MSDQQPESSETQQDVSIKQQTSPTSQQNVEMVANDSPLKSAIRANSSYKIREFEWFEVETKIRLFVQKLIEPTLKQVYEDRKVVDNISQKIDQNNNEVDYLKDIVLNQGTGIPIFEDINKKLFELDMKLEQERRKTASESSQLQSEMQRLQFNFKQINTQFLQIEQAKQQIIDEFSEMKKANLEFRETVTNTISKLQAEQTANFSWIRQQIQKCDDKFSQVDITLQEHYNSMFNQDKKISDIKSNCLEFASKHQSHLARFDKIDMILLNLTEQISVSKKLSNQVQQLHNNINTLDSYISTYQPLYFQGQISETLFNCLPQAMINKLANYESKRFDEIHKQILTDEGEAKVAEKIQEYQNFMEVITKRTSKLIQNQRISGEQVNDEKELSNTNQISEESDSDSNSKSHVTFQQDSKKTKKNNTMTAAEVLQYEELIENLKTQIKDETKEFKSRIELTIRDVYSQIKEMDEQLFMQNVQNQEQFDKKAETNQMKIQEIKDTLEQWIQGQKNIEDLLNSNFKSQEHFSAVIQSVLHYLVLVTHMLIQDEIDRQGIALLGVKDHNIDDPQLQNPNQLPQINKQKQKILSIQPNCLSCSSSPLTTMTAFKIACLAYNPTDISIDGKLFKRDQLLEICTRVLWAARKEMQECQQNKNNSESKLRESSRKLNHSVDSGSQNVPFSIPPLNQKEYSQQNSPSHKSSQINPSLQAKAQKLLNMNFGNDLKKPKVTLRSHRKMKQQPSNDSNIHHSFYM